MKLAIKFTAILASLAFLLIPNLYAAQKTVKLTTYYPAPYGEYKRLQSNENVSGKAAIGDFNNDSAFTSADLTAANVPDGGLAVMSSIRIGADATACTSANAGAMRYNNTTNAMEACLKISTSPDVWGWEAMGGGGASADYDSGWFAVSAGNDYTKAHGLGVAPSRVVIWFKVNAADTNYFLLPSHYRSQGFQEACNAIIQVNSTNVIVETTTGSGGYCTHYVFCNGTTYANPGLRYTSGYYRVLAWE